MKQFVEYYALLRTNPIVFFCVWIADSKAHDYGFHMQKFPGFWITLHATTLTISFCFSNWICLCNEKSRHWKLCHLLLWWRNRKRRRCPCSIQFCFNSGSTCCFLLVMFNITIVKKLTHNLSCEFGNHGKCSFVGRGIRWHPLASPVSCGRDVERVWVRFSTEPTIRVLTEIIDEECVACLYAGKIQMG